MESVSMATWKKSHLPTFPSGGSLVQEVREHTVAPHYQPMSSDWTDTLLQASYRDIYHQVLTPGHVDPRSSTSNPNKTPDSQHHLLDSDPSSSLRLV